MSAPAGHEQSLQIGAGCRRAARGTCQILGSVGGSSRGKCGQCDSQSQHEIRSRARNLSPTAPKHETTGASAERRQRGIALAVHSHEEKKGERDQETSITGRCTNPPLCRGVEWVMLLRAHRGAAGVWPVGENKQKILEPSSPRAEMVTNLTHLALPTK
jgi:hypothetical protein